MTTIIYKRGEYIAADRKFVGGVSGFGLEKDKLQTIGKNIYGISGQVILQECFNSIVNKYIDKDKGIKRQMNDIGEKLYELQAELKRYSENFSLLIIDSEQPDFGIYINHLEVDHLYNDFTAIGSGGAYAAGIHKGGTTNPRNIFKGVSELDNYTSEDYTLINLK